VIPLIGAIGFYFVPIYDLQKNNNSSKHENKSLYRMLTFWLFFAIMLCAGAAEQTMSQWSSSFAETGLGIPKLLGDILGPFAFAILMGSARLFYAFFSQKINLKRFMVFSAILCALSYAITAISPWPAISLVACAICGFSTGIMWPGTYSLAGKHLPYESVGMFALLAFAGDIGCLIGPSGTGMIATLFNDNLKIAFAFTTIFPLLILVLVKLTSIKRIRNYEFR
jgi:MFS family permease